MANKKRGRSEKRTKRGRSSVERYRVTDGKTDGKINRSYGKTRGTVYAAADVDAAVVVVVSRQPRVNFRRGRATANAVHL